MILGISFSTFTALHVLLSLIGIVAGFIVVYGMFAAQRMTGMTAVFLSTTLLTTLTGFLFPIGAFTPALGVGIISLLVLVVALAALYGFHLVKAWRWIYVVSAVSALYLNSFVAVVQAFQKISALQALAPTQSEPAFLIAQSVLLAVFIALGIFAVKGFHPQRFSVRLSPPGAEPV